MPADQEATLTIGQLSAGSAFNVIPETAVMQGTLRVFDNELRVQLIRRIGEVVENIAAAYRTKVEFEILGDIPALVCDAKSTPEVSATGSASMSARRSKHGSPSPS